MIRDVSWSGVRGYEERGSVLKVIENVLCF